MTWRAMQEPEDNFSIEMVRTCILVAPLPLGDRKPRIPLISWRSLAVCLSRLLDFDMHGPEMKQ